ncbi:phosphoserine phosphatase SerB [Homoserinibacter sp. YIM 151385]|uniref:phosphoserine phosphatase SerB n=1 Tax=Homoserinibacter sp. YIM 151385 TaxID=2985506 RepID=UPI0022F10FC5|nr:phosphoserine phosphatase SerB [Homoserinibacter sp. YIM 151385]WBU38583.1 phosphoserine phosphatase SerB [Homoserinibacter sp. YIM 151385]
MPSFLVVLDVDSTLIEEEAIELLAEEAGVVDEVREVTLRAMNGELDFEASLRERAATLTGLGAGVFERVRERVTLTRGVPEMAAGIRAAGGAVAVVSGGFHEIIDPVAEALRLDFWRANRLEVRDGALTGEVVPPVVDAAAKADALREWAAALDLPLARTLAIGDGANDLEMMAICGLSIGFDAKAPVRQAADLLLDERDLSAVLAVLQLPRV